MNDLPNGIRTMVPAVRIYNLIKLAESAPKGCFVECGIWRGGCIAILSLIAQKSNRNVYGFDSFEGLPAQSIEDEGHGVEHVGTCVASISDVRETYDTWNVSMDNLTLFKGWFEDSIPKNKNKIGDIALLRIDADWYNSTLVCLDELYSKVVPGGIVIIDDYNTWQGCKNATDFFRDVEKITSEIHFVDKDGEAWWIKK